MIVGTVKWYNSSKGYGFIKPDDGSADVFVHSNSLMKAKIHSLKEGDKVGYEVFTNNGRLSAVQLKML